MGENGRRDKRKGVRYLYGLRKDGVDYHDLSLTLGLTSS